MATTICPHLGGIEDRSTCFSFASPSNCCWRLKSPGEITPEHQTTHCLTPNFAQCPVYLTGHYTPEAISRRAVSAPAAGTKFNWRLWLVVAQVLIFGLIVLGVVGWEFFAPKEYSLIGFVSPPTPTFTPRPTLTRTPTATVRPTLVPTLQHTPTITATATAEPTFTSIPPTSTPGPNATDPVGPLQLFSYTVQRGDTLAILATRYKIKVNAIINVNGLDRRGIITTGQTLIIPAGAGDNETLPRFSIFQLSTEASLPVLAQQLGSTADNIRKYNGLGNDDLIPNGRLLYVPLSTTTPR